METLNEYIQEYKKQLEKGYIKQGYKGLMEYILNLRTQFKNKYPDYFVSSNIYYGYMDMTYFSFIPESLKRRKLKIAIVFIHETLTFKVWLAGCNKNVQKQYWELFTGSNWDKYHVAPAIKGVDFILDYVLIDNPDFSDLDTLTEQIETGTLNFIRNIENFLSKH